MSASTVQEVNVQSNIGQPDVTLIADHIHPNILKGLVPVFQPVFIGLDGKRLICRTEEFDYVESNNDRLNHNNYPLIGAAVKRAKECDFEYLHSIMRISTTDTYNNRVVITTKYYIRGR
jgi:hypothetical protein